MHKIRPTPNSDSIKLCLRYTARDPRLRPVKSNINTNNIYNNSTITTTLPHLIRTTTGNKPSITFRRRLLNRCSGEVTGGNNKTNNDLLSLPTSKDSNLNNHP